MIVGPSDATFRHRRSNATHNVGSSARIVGQVQVLKTLYGPPSRWRKLSACSDSSDAGEKGRWHAVWTRMIAHMACRRRLRRASKRFKESSQAFLVHTFVNFSTDALALLHTFCLDSTGCSPSTFVVPICPNHFGPV